MSPFPRKKGPTAKRRQNKAQAKRRAYALVCRAVDVRDGYRCRVCQRTTVDAQHHHIKFRSSGGKDVTSNLIRVCLPCHERIHAHLLSVKGTANELIISDPRSET